MVLRVNENGACPDTMDFTDGGERCRFPHIEAHKPLVAVKEEQTSVSEAASPDLDEDSDFFSARSTSYRPRSNTWSHNRTRTRTRTKPIEEESTFVTEPTDLDSAEDDDFCSARSNGYRQRSNTWSKPPARIEEERTFVTVKADDDLVSEREAIPEHTVRQAWTYQPHQPHQPHHRLSLTPSLTVSDCNSSLGGSYTHLADRSLDEEILRQEFDESPDHYQARRRSNTWSHNKTRLKAGRRSGSLPPVDLAMSPSLSRLSLDRDNTPFPLTLTPAHSPRLAPGVGPHGIMSPANLSPRKNGRLLVCSDHRMTCSPRLPPIGSMDDPDPLRLLPANHPKEIIREVTNIDPALIECSDPTEVRMRGRRRNAIITPSPYDEES